MGPDGALVFLLYPGMVFGSIFRDRYRCNNNHRLGCMGWWWGFALLLEQGLCVPRVGSRFYTCMSLLLQLCIKFI